MTKPDEPLIGSVGDWNKYQTFDAQGNVYLIGELTAGGFIVGRIHEDTPSVMTFVCDGVDTLDEAIAAAKLAKKKATH